MAGAALLILSAAAAWLGAPWGNKAGSTAPPSPALRSVRVSAGTATRQLVAMGTVAPARSVAVTAPYDGSIAEKKVALGDTVAERDVLIVMNAEDIQSRGREARSATLKAAIALDALTHWEAGPEVTRARRGVEAARTVLARLERKVNDTRQLYDRGIVSRVEFEAAEQERDNQAFTVATAEQDLTATLARGGADSRRLAELELENAKARLADVQRQADGTIVRAPVAGVIVKSPAV
ncbi:HlyD family secretion protein, partial [Bradyrhizobium sp.]